MREIADYSSNPELLMMQREGDDAAAEITQSQWESGRARTPTEEPEEQASYEQGPSRPLKENTMKLHDLDNIKSERGLRSIFNSLWFGSKSALLSASANRQNINNTVRQLTDAGYADRAEHIRQSPRFQQLEQAAEKAAERASAIHAFAAAKGHLITVAFDPEYQRGKDERQIKAAAQATGISEEVIKAKENKAIQANFEMQKSAQLEAETLFWSATGNDADSVDVRAETVLNSLLRQRDFMLEWTTIDLAELTLLKHDIDFMTKLIGREEQKGEPTEGSIDDPKDGPSMVDMNRQYQKEIADTKKALTIDEHTAHKSIGKGGKAGTARVVKAA